MNQDSVVLELLDRVCALSGARWVALAFPGQNGEPQRYLRGRDPVLPQVEQNFFRDLEQCSPDSEATPERWAEFTRKWKARSGLYRRFDLTADATAFYCHLGTIPSDDANAVPAEWIELLLQSVAMAAAGRAGSQFEFPRRQAVLESAISMLQASGEEELIPRWLGLALRLTGADGAAYLETSESGFELRHIRAEGELKAALERQAPPLSDVLTTAATATTGQRYVRPDLRDASGAAPASPLGDLIALPLVREQAARGVLVVVRSHASPTGEMDLHLLGLFARQLQGMVDNLRLVDRLQAANRELSAAQARLVEAARLQALGEVAARVAHDVNNVLGALLGRIQLLQYSLSDPTALNGLAKMEALVGDGEATVRRLQEAARIDTEAESNRKPLDVLVRDVFINSEYALRQQSQIHGRRQVWTTDFNPTGPFSGAAGRLQGALRQLLLDLPDYVAPDARFQLQTGWDENTNWLSIRIHSEPAARAAELETLASLSLLRATVAPLGGVVVLKEELTSLLLHLAFASEERPASNVEEASGAVYRLLVVDDDDAVREVLEELLRTDGHDVRAARDGDEALRLCGSTPFDLVFTDLGMPGISGWEVAEAIKRDLPDLPVVMITGWGAQVDPERLKQSGVDRVLAKPFQWPAVRDTIEGLLGEGRG